MYVCVYTAPCERNETPCYRLYHASVFGSVVFGPSQNALFIKFHGTPSISVFVLYLTDNLGLLLRMIILHFAAHLKDIIIHVATNKFVSSFKFVAQISDTFDNATTLQCPQAVVVPVTQSV